VLTRIFGSENLDLAEDVVQDSLIEALNQWTYKGIPEKPSAWLFMVAKNKALNIINRENYTRKYSSDVAHYLKSQRTAAGDLFATLYARFRVLSLPRLRDYRTFST
jgi:predicted RNA polymerase sigma factor